MRKLPITKGHFTIVDDDDFERVCIFRWCYYGDGYAARGYRENGKVRIVRLHHMIIGNPRPGFLVDHINGNRLDNRKSNLRFVTNQQNIFNSQKRQLIISGGNSSKYKGVTWMTDSNKWRNRITLGGREFHLGVFESEQEAALAYNQAAIKFYGEYSKLNQL
jgi:hypothetical protein